MLTNNKRVIRTGINPKVILFSLSFFALLFPSYIWTNLLAAKKEKIGNYARFFSPPPLPVCGGLICGNATRQRSTYMDLQEKIVENARAFVQQHIWVLLE